MVLTQAKTRLYRSPYGHLFLHGLPFLTLELRYILGPMMLVGIFPGYGRMEPKSLDPYKMC